MTKQDKKLLQKELCTRLNYGVICHTEKGDGHLCSINLTIFGTEYGLNISPIKRDYFCDSKQDEIVIKPYLRPMSSMTEEERDEIEEISHGWFYVTEDGEIFPIGQFADSGEFEDAILPALEWLNKHGFDYRGLIPMGLALEATIDMYK